MFRMSWVLMTLRGGTSGILLATLPLVLVACPEQSKPSSKEEPASHEPSPNASMQPAALEETESFFFRTRPDAGAIDSGLNLSTADADAVPTALREDSALPADNVVDRDIRGNTLEAVFAWHDLPGPLPQPELDATALEVLRQKTVLSMNIHLTTVDRMSVVFNSPAFPLGTQTELRARRDRYGHVLVWPTRKTYRPAPPGVLRALIGERRMDVVPLVAGTAENKGRSKTLGYATVKVSLSGPFGTLELEQAEIPGLPRAGMLLCRLLIELAGLKPSSSACEDTAVPLRAEYHWKDGGRLSFVATKLGRRRDYQSADVSVPPQDADFAPGILPSSPGQFMDADELLTIFHRDAPLSPDQKASTNTRGLVATNRTAVFSALLVNGVAVAWIAPNQERVIVGLHSGRYALSFRDFHGQNIIAAKTGEVPGRIVAGEVPDAGSPDD